jgi:hypothetical protein
MCPEILKVGDHSAADRKVSFRSENATSGPRSPGFFEESSGFRINIEGAKSPGVHLLRKDKSEMTILYPQLRYLGTIPKPDHAEYGFQMENSDKTLRLLVMTIANSVFLTRQLMVQEAPDLCYQKLLAYLRDATAGPAEDYIPVSESDIADYRAFHPNVKVHGKKRQPL